MLACPRCSYPLELHVVGHNQIDWCHRCRGTFIDVGDVAPNEAMDPDVWMQLPGTERLGPQDDLPCPHEHGPMYGFRVKDISSEVDIDLCLECGGLWLDEHEMASLNQIGQRAIAAEDAEQKSELKSFNVITYLFQLLTGAPIEVWNPVRRTPYVLYLLIVSMVALFGMEMYFLFQGGEAGLMSFVRGVGVVPSALLAGTGVWTLLTYAFFHASLLHIFLNLYFLYIFGDNVEDVLGHKRFFLFFGLTAIAGGLTHALIFPGQTMPLIGASGAVAGMMGAYLILFPRVKVWVVFFFVRFKIRMVWFLLFWIGMQVVRGFLQLQGGSSSVAWFAHIGGFAVGLLFILLSGRQTLLREAGFELPQNICITVWCTACDGHLG